MMRVLLLLGLLGGCAPQVELTLLSLAEVSNPVVDLEFTVTAGDRKAFLRIEGEPLPVREPITLPDGFSDQFLSFEVRAFVGAREVAFGEVEVAPGEQEATVRFAVCSNGASEGNEACDDGNLRDGDGCDSTCRPTGCESGVSTPGELCFAENDDLRGPPQPRQVLAADFDGDGAIDLAAPYTADGVVRFFPGDGKGFFGDFVEVAVPGVERLASEDINGDGFLDLVAVAKPLSTSELVVLLGDSAGGFTVGDGGALGADVKALTLADLDGDGLPDLVFADKSTGQVKVRLGLGGAFAGVSQSLTVGVSPVALAAADLDGDGALDVASANAGGSVTLLLGGGDGALTPQLPLFVGGVPSAMVLGDFNRDGLLDLAVTKQESGKGLARVFQGRFAVEGFSLEFVADFDAPLSPSAVVAADFDSDGALDLAITGETGSLVAVQFNNGQGQFDAPRDASGGEFNTRIAPVSLVASDLNGDSVPDLVAAGENLGLLLSNP